MRTDKQGFPPKASREVASRRKVAKRTRCRSPSDDRFGEGRIDNGERTATINGEKGNDLTILIDKSNAVTGGGERE